MKELLSVLLFCAVISGAIALMTLNPEPLSSLIVNVPVP